MARFQQRAPAAVSRRDDPGELRAADLVLLPAFVALLFGELAAFGLNDAFPSALGAAADLVAALVLICAYGRSTPRGFWTRQFLPALLLLAAAAWAAWGLAPGVRRDWAEPFRVAAQAPALSLAPDLVLLEIAKLLGLGALGLGGALVACEPRRLRLTVDLVLSAAGLYVVACLLLNRQDEAVALGLDSSDGRWRFTASLLNPNAAGCIFAMLAAVAAGALRGAADRLAGQPRMLWTPHLPRIGLIGLLIFVLAGATALTQSRTALACEVAAIALAMAWPGERRRGASPWRLVLAPAIAIAVGLGLAVTGVSVFDRNGEFAASALGRTEAYADLWAKTLQAPLHGYGLGAFPQVLSYGLEEPQAALVWSFRSAHDAPLQAALEGGLPYLALLVLALAAWLGPAVAKGPPAGLGALRRGLLTGAAVAGASGLVDIALNVPAVAALCIVMLGLYAGSAAPKDG